MKKIGVIIGRFQTHRIHVGHISLFDAVKERSDDTIILIGSAVPKLTNKNPMDYKTREFMIKSMFTESAVAGIRDFKLNEKWSENVDKTIQSIVDEKYLMDGEMYITDFEVTLYGCRDSFIPFYSGKFKTEELFMAEIEGVSATQERKLISQNPIDSEDFRAGIIYAVGNKYPTTYPTVDVAILNHSGQILLGRKEFEKEFRFIGGFVDPTDLTLENAGLRECNEEIGGGYEKLTDEQLLINEIKPNTFIPKYLGNVVLKDFKYISSRKVNDWRYRNTSDGIMTTFFVTKYISGDIIASDDIVEAKWFDLYSLKEEDIVGEHIPLIFDLKKTLVINE